MSSIAVRVTAVARALTMEENPSLMQFLQMGLAYLAAPVIVVFAGGMFWRGATSAGAVTTLVVAPLVCFLCQNVHRWIGWWPSHMVYWMPIAVGILLATLVAVSSVTPRKSEEELSGLIWNREMSLRGEDRSSRRGARHPWWRDYRCWAVLAIVLMLAEIWWLR